jgi:hypothetical protein
MFRDRSDLLRSNPAARHYGVAVADLDGHAGPLAFVVAGYDGPNRVFRWRQGGYREATPPTLADAQRQALGLAAGDVLGTGREALYILNTDTYAGPSRHADRLFAHADDGVSLDGQEAWIDLFERPVNRQALNRTAGRSVAALDRHGRGTYAFFVANYGGPMRLYEDGNDGSIRDVAPQAGVARVTGGRSAVPLSLVSDGRTDLFAGNEDGPNFLFVNQGDGTFAESAARYGLDDPDGQARGVACFDDLRAGFGLALGNWMGTHRLFVQADDADGRFEDVATDAFAQRSRVRTVIAADFDNDGYEEIFVNNLGDPNRLFSYDAEHARWWAEDCGAAREPNGLGTGAAVADLDGDGRLELLVAHGEQGAQPLSLFHGPDTTHHFLRVRPTTRHGAPARGAVVTCTAAGRTQRRSIDGGSGYLCQMEPVAHFGLGATRSVEAVNVRWPGGATVTLEAPAVDTVHRVAHPEA